jgi:hypothetical protein
MPVAFDEPDAARFNLAMEHPTIGLGLRYIARRGAAAPGEFVRRLALLKSLPAVPIGALIDAADAAGCPLRGVALDFAEISQLPLPVLAYLKQSPAPGAPLDLIQICRVGRKFVSISKDRFGEQRLARSEVEMRWSGIVLLPLNAVPSSARGAELEAYSREVRVIPDLLTAAECRELIDYCEATCFQRSRVAQLRGTGRDHVVSAKVRSSSSTTLFDRSHSILARLYRQCADWEDVPTTNIENIQCVRYKYGQRFRPHYDGGFGLPRLTTYLVYLNDGIDGGETYFPLLDKAVAPVAGSALRFPSCDRSGRVRWQSEHGGLPVRAGIKYALNIWVRCERFPGLRDEPTDSIYTQPMSAQAA